MEYSELRKELYSFYLEGDVERSKGFAEKCFAIMDSKYTDGMSVAEQKMLQYNVICEEFQPVIFKHCPFFWETGVLTSLSDGARSAKGHKFIQANGWVYNRNSHLFKEDTALYERKKAQQSELLYLICGPYNDDSQHYNFNNRPILASGLKGIYKRAEAELKKAITAEEKDFLRAVCHGMLALKKMAEKFSDAALLMLNEENDEECKNNLLYIYNTAKNIPWEAPKSFYEALATVAFMRTAFGSLEGVGPNTFGRLDRDLAEFYYKDIENGTLKKDSAYELISKFLII